MLESSVGFRLAIGSCDHYISKGIDSAYTQCLILEISVETKNKARDTLETLGTQDTQRTAK